MKGIRYALLGIYWIAAGVAAQPLPSYLLNQFGARSLAPSGLSGRITAVDAIWNKPNVIFAGTASGGVWKSENGGTSWKAVFDEQSTLAIGALAIQQSNPSVVWVGTGEGNARTSVNMGNGIYKSLDGGRSWKRMGLEKSQAIHRILIDPANPNIVYAGVMGFPFGDHPERGVYKTVNGGLSWDRILHTNEKSGVVDMIMDPSNPQKLLVAMWQHRRTPWDFRSGGPGSGLYITYDGGRTWAKKSKADGLPEGSLGRINLTISRSMPTRLYAFIETGDQNLYRSDDGGESWTKVSEEPAPSANRLFESNALAVDPKNENRIYRLSQPLSVSEDGGRSFRTMAPQEQRSTGHYAFWVHPDNPNLLLDGSGKGLFISHDRGRTWSSTPIPVAQYTHIQVDDAVPYNVYGGTQDNGFWTGPAYRFSAKGALPSSELLSGSGDGYTLLPDPVDARFGYALSEGGRLIRYDQLTGRTSFIRPPESNPAAPLRFNPNAGMALDPFDRNALYCGSQFLHKSADNGLSWEVLSPDLTLNRPEQRDRNGSDTDLFGADTYHTILSIAPSPREQGVVWVGTDDGNVQLTRDGGKTWVNLRDRIPGLPKESWIAQIKASRHRPGEAFVVANHYRLGNDVTPYIFRTTDYGQSWSRLADEKKVVGYALCFLQDPVEPKLLFAGTEQGLWVSIDEGRSWARWNNGIPPVSTTDLALQEREADLIVGTFGRSVYVVDNIRPLRELAATGGRALTRPLVVFDPAEAYLTANTPLPGNPNESSLRSETTGRHRPPGATITYYIKPQEQIVAAPAGRPARSAMVSSKLRRNLLISPEPAPTGPTQTPANQAARPDSTDMPLLRTDTLNVRIYDDSNRLVRTLKILPDSGHGFLRFTWDLSEKGFREPGSPRPRYTEAETSGLSVLPGRYKVQFRYVGIVDSTYVTVKPDPRLPLNAEASAARRKLLSRLGEATRQLTEATDRLQEAAEAVDLLASQLRNKTGLELEVLRRTNRTIQDSLLVYRAMIVGQPEKQTGVRQYTRTPVSKLAEARLYLTGRTEAPTRTETQLVEQTEQLTRAALDRVNQFFRIQWVDYRKKVETVSLSLVKEYGDIR